MLDDRLFNLVSLQLEFTPLEFETQKVQNLSLTSFIRIYSVGV